MRSISGRRILLGAAAPVGALIVAAIISAAILLLTGHNPSQAFGAMFDAFGKSRVLVGTNNQAASY